MIPDDVKTWIRNTLAENHTNLPHGRLDWEGEQIDRWLRNLPSAPEPDWREAPKGVMFDWLPDKDAQFCTIDADGLRKWHYTEPAIIRNEWRCPYYRYDDSGCKYVDLPIGVDWRTTLRKRPEKE